MLAALLLGLFAPRAFGTLIHDHDASHPSSTEVCAACTLGHTPASSAPSAITLRGPNAVAARTLVASGDEPSPTFDFAVPYACGPPA